MRFCPQCHGRYEEGSRFCPRDGVALPLDEQDSLIGSVLMEQFELLEVAGRGAMGTVYKAFQTGMDRQVAVKLLRPELVRDPAVVKRFDREARAVARLSHPNIVTFFVVGVTDEAIPFVVMEYVEGASLAQVLDREGRFEPVRALRVGRQVTSALTEAHGEGIVHRDLKPANILLSQRRRQNDFVKILDFGIAKVLRGEATAGMDGDVESRITRTGAIFGTPHYISPEQAAGGDVDHRADLYSLGIILFRLICGKLPFEGAGISVLVQHIQQAPPDPEELVPGIDARLRALLLKSIEKEPVARYQSAEEMSDALDAVVSDISGGHSAWTSFSGRMPAVRPPTLTGGSTPNQPRAAMTLQGMGAPLGAETSSPSDKSPVPAPAGALSPPVAAGVVAAGSATGVPAFQEAAPSEPVPYRRSRTPLWFLVGGLLVAGGAVGTALWWKNHQASEPVAAAAAADKAPAVAPGSAPSSAPAAIVVPVPVPTATSLPAVAPAAAPDAGVAAEVTPPPTRTHTVGEGGWSVRATVPEPLDPAAEATLSFLVLDPDGKPLVAESVPATIEDARGSKISLTIGKGDEPGVFVTKRTFATAGRYHMHLYLVPAKKTVVWFDLQVGPETAEPAPTRSGHGHVHEGGGGADPYHLVGKPPPKKVENPDGLE